MAWGKMVAGCESHEEPERRHKETEQNAEPKGVWKSFIIQFVCVFIYRQGFYDRKVLNEICVLAFPGFTMLWKINWISKTWKVFSTFDISKRVNSEESKTFRMQMTVARVEPECTH